MSCVLAASRSRPQRGKARRDTTTPPATTAGAAAARAAQVIKRTRPGNTGVRRLTTWRQVRETVTQDMATQRNTKISKSLKVNT